MRKWVTLFTDPTLRSSAYCPMALELLRTKKLPSGSSLSSMVANSAPLGISSKKSELEGGDAGSKQWCARSELPGSLLIGLGEGDEEVKSDVARRGGIGGGIEPLVLFLAFNFGGR